MSCLCGSGRRACFSNRATTHGDRGDHDDDHDDQDKDIGEQDQDDNWPPSEVGLDTGLLARSPTSRPRSALEALAHTVYERGEGGRRERQQRDAA